MTTKAAERGIAHDNDALMEKAEARKGRGDGSGR